MLQGQRWLWSMLILSVLIVTAACNRPVAPPNTAALQETTTGGVSPNPAQIPVISQRLIVQSTGPDILNVPQQLNYIPGRAGGSSDAAACYGPQLEELGPSDRLLFTTDSVIEPAESLIICYYNFTPGVVRERVVAPDGTEIRTWTEFTIDDFGMPETLAANDYTALPGDQPGTYTIEAETLDGSVSANFTVSRDVQLISDKPSVDFIGRGTNATALHSAAYLMMSGFAPSDNVTLYFYMSCVSAQNQYVPTFSLSGTASVSVDAQGAALVPLTPEDLSGIDTMQSYYVTAVGERTTALTEYRGMNISTDRGFRSFLGPVAAETTTGASTDEQVTCPPPQQAGNTSGTSSPFAGQADQPGSYNLIRPTDWRTSLLTWSSGRFIMEAYADSIGARYLYGLDSANGEGIWQYDSPRQNSATATLVDNDVVFVASRDLLEAIEAVSGTVLWAFPSNGRSLSSYMIVDEQNIYIGLDDQLVALDLRTGAPRFAVTLEGSLVGLLSAHGLLVVQFIDWRDDGISPSLLRAYDTSDGRLRWEYALPPGIVGTFAQTADNLVWGGSSEVIAFDPTSGNLRWQTSLKPGFVVGIATTADDDLIIGSQGFVINGRYTGLGYRLDGEQGEIMWRALVGDDVQSQPLLQAGQALFATTDGVHAIDLMSGVETWHLQASQLNAVYRASDDSLLVANADDMLYAFTPLGEVLWQAPLLGRVRSVALGDGVVLVSLDEGGIVRLQ